MNDVLHQCKTAIKSAKTACEGLERAKKLLAIVDAPDDALCMAIDDFDRAAHLLDGYINAVNQCAVGEYLEYLRQPINLTVA